jgi:transposase
MVFKRVKPHITLTDDERKYLETITRSRTAELRMYERARIILMDSEGKNPGEIARDLGTNRTKVYLVINKALTLGIESALHDRQGRGKPRSLGDDARSYIINTACTKPLDLGMPQELWTNRSLTAYIRSHAPPEYNLHGISNGTISKILTKSSIRPHKIRYYMEKIDPEHERKETEILHVYRDVKILKKSGEESLTAVLSYDEKPGIQAIGNIYPDKSPDPDHGYVSRNHDYVRHGTLSLMAGIDLFTGHIIPLVEERHRSTEFIRWLDMVDRYYPEDYVITIILDNHSVHSSRETMEYLGRKPHRFRFVFTPTHASWLNIIETFFSKITRTMLRGIRADSKEDLKKRILSYIEETNSEPVVFTWKYRMDEMPGGIGA